MYILYTYCTSILYVESMYYIVKMILYKELATQACTLLLAAGHYHSW